MGDTIQGRQSLTWVNLPKEIHNEHDTSKRFPIIYKDLAELNERKQASRYLTERQIHLEEDSPVNLKKLWKQRQWKETMGRLDRAVDWATYASLLRWCGKAKALSEGKHVHAHLVRSKHKRNGFLGNLLVQMYGKCGALKDAHGVFAEMKQRNVFSWTILIGAYAQYGHAKEAIRLFQEMKLEGVMPNKVTFISILSACGSQAALVVGRQMHDCIVGTAFESDIVVGNALVTMYGKCGSLGDARRIFDKMHERNVISWNTIIAAYAQHGKGKEALQLFQQMQLEGVIPDKVTFISILLACGSEAALAEGKQMHNRIAVSGFESDVAVGTALINMYGKCGSLEAARRMFDKMPERNVASWTAMIAAYVQHGAGKEALRLFQQMQLDGVTPGKVTFVSILNACDNQTALAEGKQLHTSIVDSGFESDVVVGTALVNMYGKCGSLEDARRIFDKMPQRDVVAWNVVISSYVQHGHGKEALQLFRQMKLEHMIPDKVTFISILLACGNETTLAEGKRMHKHVVDSGLESDVAVGTALINMYGKCNSLEDAQRVFDNLPEQDVVAWTAIIAAYAQHGRGKEALQLFQQMQLDGVVPDKVIFVNTLSACVSNATLAEGRWMHALIVESGFEFDVAVGNALISMYGRCGTLEDARRVFDKIPERGVVSWNAMIAAYVQQGQGKEGLQLFQHMQLEGVNPDKFSIVSILSICASLGALTQGKQMHAHVVGREFESDAAVGNALINMYGKCGSLGDARRVFERIPGQDVISWNAIISAYAQHGQGKQVLQLFQQMQLGGVIPNKASFVSILSACSHAGMVNEGCHHFVSMLGDHGITPTVDHYNCMVDLLGRAGCLNEGEDLIHNMPFQPDVMSWTTLLGACRRHFDLERVQRVAEHVFELDPGKVAPYVLLSNIYAAAGKWDDAAKVRKMMEDKGLKEELS